MQQIADWLKKLDMWSSGSPPSRARPAIRTGAGRACALVEIQIVDRKAFALHCPVFRILIDRGAVAPVERFAVEF